MGNIGSWEERRKGFDWSVAARELGWRRTDPINIGWFCSDRIRALGHGERSALVWENAAGEERRFSFADLAERSSTAAAFLLEHGVEPGDRVCLFLDRIPELYFSFLGILKLGAIVQPLFSAFREESLFARLDGAETACVITQRAHLGKVRRVRERLPALRQVLVVDAGGHPLLPGEVDFDLERAPASASFPIHPAGPETPSVLHYTSGTTGQPKGAQHVHC